MIEFGRPKAAYWISRLIIPAIMVLMVARAVWLSNEYNLSPWKGGGMGMFSSADSTATRYARIFIEAPNKERYPLFRLTSDQNKFLMRALWYPNRQNFIPLANSIRATQWATSNVREEVGHYSSKGELLRKGPESFELLSPLGSRPAGQPTNFGIIIEYHALSYDVDKRSLESRPISSFRFDRME